jgi:hypothetical protein
MSDRTEFLKHLPKGSVGVEVGVWLGDFSQEILDVVEPTELSLVDPWEQNDDATNRMSTMERSQEELDAIYQGVSDRFAEEPVVIRRGRSLDVASDFIDPVDWVYIDGIHTFDAVSADLEAWWPHVKPGGMICGHDMWWEGVRKAVSQFAVKQNLALVEIDGNFLIRKREG